ncbi:MAG TPA: DinB family protein [Vicinamibacterales bacterium]|jgi:uncharacterized damage-inducible protein DinB
MRQQLSDALAWGDAHARFEQAVRDFPPRLRGRRVRGLPYSGWEILEHMRRTQHDILDFSRNAKYKALTWPADYWPGSPEPPDAKAWDRSVAAFRRDRRALQRMASDATLNLARKIPHGDGQTYAREMLLVIDHNAYHLGELIMLRRLLGVWR